MSWASSTSLAHQEELLAPGGFVHDVTGDQQGDAGRGEVVEQRPELVAQLGVGADSRLVEHQELRGAEQRDGEVRTAALPAGKAADHSVRARFEPDLARSPARHRTDGAPSTAAK